MKQEQFDTSGAGSGGAVRLPAWQLDGPALLRLAAFPASRLNTLTMPQSVAWQRRLAGQENLLDVERSYVCERILFQAAGTFEGSNKSALVAIKRKLHNRLSLQAGDWVVLALLPGLRERRLVRRYTHRLERLERWKKEARHVFAAELTRQRCRLQDLVTKPDFLLGLQLHNTSLAAHARKLACVEPDNWRKAERNTEATLMRYVARATAKTSPFGRWGLVAPLATGTAKPEHCPTTGLVLDARAACIEVRSRLNLQLCARIAASLQARYAITDQLPLTPNPTRFREGQAIGFFSAATAGVNIAYSRLRSGPLSAPVEQLLTLLENATRGLSKADWIDQARRHPELASLGGDKVSSLISQVHRSGLVQSASLLPSDALDGLSTFARRAHAMLGTQIQPACDALHELEALGQEYATRDVAGRDAARTRIVQLCAALGVDDIDGIAPVIEDSIVHGVEADLGSRLRLALEHQLGPLLSLFARRDSNGLHHRMLVDIFVASYGVGGRCGNPAHFAAQALRLCERHRTDDTHIFPRFAQARAAYASFMHTFAALAESKHSEVSLCEQDLQQLAQTCMAADHATGVPRRLGVLVQVAAASAEAMECGEFDLIINQTLPGWGRFYTRYAQLIDNPAWVDALRAVLQRLQSVSGNEILELQTTLQHNAHVHPALTPRALSMPGESSARADLLALDGLTVEHDAASDTLRFAYDGQAVLPLYMGCLHTMSLPPVQRVLSDAVAPYAYQAEASNLVDFIERQARPCTSTVRIYPRLRYGRVILQRRSWAVDVTALPEHTADDYTLFSAYQHWQSVHGLPDRVYVRVILRKPGEPGRIRDHKPVYLEFANQLLLRSFIAGLDSASVQTLIFEEALPDPELSVVDLGLGGPHVVELQLELEEVLP
ncbi:hypothetical protein F2P44_08850 [Massilia sp. CCM 8695]|uniref:Lantibiotic dehydratase N-terminal domain-containing protein n=1 Tax=Massilia frigida TaxID=2609281 RepID=A0ABX0N241_9BURK|nr:lantibiotic dehydratase [Massilia frigida]NHZ79383.1 hypothetical protein [Massilia frigida]